ncbi:MAG: hypothetical protein R3B84_12085 [Zavarzinella sp.]
MQKLCAFVILSSFLASGYVGAQESYSSTDTAGRETIRLPASLEQLSAKQKKHIYEILQYPTLKTQAPAEKFVANKEMYQWLLDHPDKTSKAWQNLGVAAINIQALNDGRFVWKDETGSEVVWYPIATSERGRIWYATGKVKPAKLIPTVPVTAVALLTHSDEKRPAGDATITHKVEVFMQTDSKVASVVTRMMGDQIPTMAQTGCEQMLLFFSGIARYTHQKPEKIDGLFQTKKQ